MKRQFTPRQTKKIMEFTINGKPVVQELWYESDFGEVSVWIALKDGFNWDGCSCVHEDDFKSAWSSLNCVVEGEPY